MTSSLPIEEIVDRCVEEIRGGRATVEDCLRRYPEQRDMLEPLLRAVAAMSALPRGGQPAPDPARRAAFMAALRETPQQRRARRLPPIRMLFGAGAFRVVGPAFALAALAIALVLGGGGTPASASTLTVFEGQVERLDGVAWRVMRDGEEVLPGVRMRTSEDGYALVTFPDGSTVVLDPRTEITVETLASAPRRVEVRQQSGRLWHDVVHDASPGARFVVVTPDARVEVFGTVFETSVDARSGQTDVATVDGEVRVIAGDRTVPVGRGEVLSASKSTVKAVTTAPLLDSALTVSGPFAAAIMAPDGRGTGVRTDGVVFRQLRGVTTSRRSGMQRFDLQNVDQGEFTLVLVRYGDGEGEVVLDGPAGQQRFSVSGGTRVARLPLRLEVVEGVPAFVAQALQGGDDLAAPTARVAQSERTKDAVDLASEAKAAASTRVAAERTPTPAKVSKEEEKRPDSGREEKDEREKKPPTPTRTPIATPTQATFTATPTPTPRASATPDAALVAYQQRLRAAIATGKVETVRAVLAEALSGDNASLKRGRVALIATALENETNAQRIGAVFVAGQEAGLRDAMRAALSEGGGEGRGRFDAAIAAADARRQKQPEQRTPTVTPTRSATAPITNTARPAATTTATAGPR